MADSRTATPTNPADTILAIRKTMETHMGDVMHVDLSNKTIKLERTKSGNLVSDPFQSSNVSKPSAPRSLSRSNSDMRLHSMSTATSQAGRGAGAAAAAAVVSGAPVPPIDGEPGRSYGLRHSHSQSQSLSGSQHGGDPSSRMGSRQELSSLKSSKADLRNMGSLRNLSSTSNVRSLEALGARGAAAAAAGGRKYGSISNLNRINEATATNAAPTPAQEKAAAAKQIESILNKAQRKIDARLEKAEDNLWKTNESLYKAHGTTMYPSKTTGSSSNFSVFAAANKAASDELDIDSRSARRSREGGGNDDRDGGDSDDENEEGFGSLSRSGSHFLLNKSVKLPPIGGGGALASTAGGSKSGSAHLSQSLSQTDLSKQNVTSRLTDPNSYPPAYKAKFEAIKKHKEAYKSSEKLSDKRTSSTNLSLKEAEVVKRLTDNGSKAKSRTSLERLEYTGYTNGFKPMDESEKEKLRAKGFANSNRIDFFSEFTPQGSRAGSRRASMIERNKPGADMAGSMGNLHSPDAPKLGGSSDSVQQTSAPKEQRKQSMTGLVEDMPPPRPPHELQKDTSYKRF